MIVLIGDAHGKIKQLMRIVEQSSPHPTIQLGDMGIGFSGVGFGKQRSSFSWIRGNHDNPAKCRAYHNYLGDYGTLELESRRIFYLAGAVSIDRDCRIEDISWWAGEQLNDAELSDALKLYKDYKPDLVLTHECPQQVGREMLTPLLLNSFKGTDYHRAKLNCCNSITAIALQAMFETHQPKDWVFGHYHMDTDLHINGTHFHCCAELSTYAIATDALTETLEEK